MSRFSRTVDLPLTPFEKKPNGNLRGDDLDYSYAYGDDDQITSAEERAFVRKIDLLILPIICTINFMQFLDKTTINYAAMLDFNTDLNIDKDQYNVIASIFYLGYLVYQVPNNYLLQVVPVGRYIGLIVFIWGAILLCHGFGHTFSQMVAMRFLLGLFEAGIYPALTLLVATFYRRAEQPTRLGIVWLCNGFAMILGGAITYGIKTMPDNHGLAGWRWIMFILGGITCLLGIVAFFFLIDNPKSKYLHLNAEQEILVEERTRDNAVVRTTVIKRDQIIEALKETRLWAFCFACLAFNLGNGGLTIYSSQITHAFGFNEYESILLAMPVGALDIFFILLGVYLVYKLNQTLYVACAVMCTGTLGMLLMIVIPDQKYKLIGQYITYSYTPTYVLMLASISNNVSGYTKKIFYNGVMMIFYTVGNFLGPYVMAPRFLPTYVGSFVIYICANMIGVVLLLVARWRMAIVNRQRLARNTGVITNVEDDLTDVQDPNFVYRL
ncbi:hypothetical protein DFQ28_011303 [Apophysomyces sp. BC1034]|nr:hypothetical protein DFQ30_011102 [Apophysomyces sp. BC1015]KAG0169349.1 hypothetical protein DFQ29_009732 [Apophysomyces sp. BC1021]KAG0184374.1 hypothetical protein DFQ28_011303 [Apophysomyces sp. BC1034]